MRTPTLRFGFSLLVLATLLAAPLGAVAQDTCDVVIALDEAAAQPIAAYGIDYSSAGGTFVGSGFQPACTRLFPGFENTIFDDDVGLLSNFVASLTGIPATQALISCVLALDGGFPCPAPSAFVVTAANFPPIAPAPEPPPPPALSISVTPRTPVCGDGFIEGAEACDDGNLTDGDCCSSSCVAIDAGTPCTDGSVCTLAATCDDAAHCVVTSSLACDDGDPCSTDSCDATLGCVAANVPAPPSQCAYGIRGAIDIRDEADAAKDKLQWQQALHDPASPGSLGNPAVDTDYALCIYDEVADVATLTARIDVPAGANWQTINPTRFQYKDPTRSVNGVERLRIDGKPKGLKLHLKAARAALPLPGPVTPDRYFADDDRVHVQLRNGVGGCWSLTFGGVQQNTATRFKAIDK
jgi:cysteine-rich repeat protein